MSSCKTNLMPTCISIYLVSSTKFFSVLIHLIGSDYGLSLFKLVIASIRFDVNVTIDRSLIRENFWRIPQVLGGSFLPCVSLSSNGGLQLISIVTSLV